MDVYKHHFIIIINFQFPNPIISLLQPIYLIPIIIPDHHLSNLLMLFSIWMNPPPPTSPPCIYYIIVVNLPTVNWLVDHYYPISTTFYQRDFSTAPSVNSISTSFICIIIYFSMLLILSPNFSSLSIFICLYLFTLAVFSFWLSISLFVFIYHRACREFIYHKGNLNETTWIEPEPKQWIKLIIHPFCPSLHDLSLCFIIYLSWDLPLPFLFPKFSVPHPVIPPII